MQLNELKRTYKSQKQGFTLVELLITIAIFAIMATVAAPNLSNTLAKKSVNEARTTLIQAIKKAKKIAHAESTFVDVTINSTTITLRKLNTDTEQIITLPKRINIAVEVRFRFNTTGNVLLFDADDNTTPAAANTPIQVVATADNTILDTILISPAGRVSS